jgi:hypothetical protein
MAKTIYKDLKSGPPITYFKADLSVSVNRHHHLANVHKEAPVKLRVQFCLSMEYKGYPPHSIFDVDKPALLEKKIPNSIYN